MRFGKKKEQPPQKLPIVQTAVRSAGNPAEYPMALNSYELFDLPIDPNYT